MEVIRSHKEGSTNIHGQKLVTNTTTVTCNINQTVRVQLTSPGIDFWMKKHGKTYGAPSMWSSVVPTESVERYMTEDFAVAYNIHYAGGGWFEFQLHRLIGLFGEAMENANFRDIPFKTQIMIIERDTTVVEHTSIP